MSFRCLATVGLVLVLASCSPGAREPTITPIGVPRVSDQANPVPTVAEDKKADGARSGDAKAEDEDTKADVKQADVPPGELIDQAQRSARGGDMKRAIELLEKALRIEPESRTALFLLAIVCQSRASKLERPENSPLFIESAEAMRKLRDAHKDLSDQEKFVLAMSLYNEASTYAVEGEQDKALATLDEAIDAGFDRLELLDVDADFASLRKSPRFQDLRKLVETNAIVRAREHAKEMLAENKPFKFDFRLPDLNDKDVSLSDLKGKVTIVDVWGTWCPPCLKEIPHFIGLYKKYHDRGLEIVGINYERADKAGVQDAIKAFVEENKIPYPCVIGDDETQGQIPDFEGFPTTLFLDRAGKVRLKVVGYRTMADLDAIVSILLEEEAEESGD
jgi:thiol-disulfide isomerase/thioredoxin